MRKLLLGVVSLVALIACGSGDGQTDATDSLPPASSSASSTASSSVSSSASTVSPADPFPITLTGALGEVVIEQRPQRVLAVTGADLDTVVALGVTPVAVPTDDAGQQIDYPWLEDSLPDDLPVLDVNASTSLPLEQIAALDPDLIVANGYWDLATYYDDLSHIAPVVHFVNGQNADSWQDTTTIIATALGRVDAATELIARTDDVIATTAAQHPDFAGHSFDLVIARDAVTVSIMRSEYDAMGQAISALGLTLSDFARSVPGDDLKVPLSVELIGDIHSDVFFIVGPNGIGDTLAADPVWAALPAFTRGSTVVLTRGAPDALALGFPTALRLQWLMGEIAPRIETALAGR